MKKPRYTAERIRTQGKSYRWWIRKDGKFWREIGTKKAADKEIDRLERQGDLL